MGGGGGGVGGGDRPSDRVQTILGNYAEFPEVHIMCLKQVCCVAKLCDQTVPIIKGGGGGEGGLTRQ